MKLEQQVTNLELSKKLKELGYPQEGLVFWSPLDFLVVKPKVEYQLEAKHLTPPEVIEVVSDDTRQVMGNSTEIVQRGYVDTIPFEEFIVAPTVAELGEWLPYGFRSGVVHESESDKGRYKTYNASSKMVGRKEYNKNDIDFVVEQFQDENEANARAKMLIWLVENGYVDLNKGGKE